MRSALSVWWIFVLEKHKFKRGNNLLMVSTQLENTTVVKFGTFHFCQEGRRGENKKKWNHHLEQDASYLLEASKLLQNIKSRGREVLWGFFSSEYSLSSWSVMPCHSHPSQNKTVENWGHPAIRWRKEKVFVASSAFSDQSGHQSLTIHEPRIVVAMSFKTQNKNLFPSKNSPASTIINSTIINYHQLSTQLSSTFTSTFTSTIINLYINYHPTQHQHLSNWKLQFHPFSSRLILLR